MSELPLAQGYWDQAASRSDRVRLNNMIVLADKASPTKFAYRTRWGLSAYAEYGTGPIRRMWQQEGTLGGATLTVSDDALYVDGSLVGVVGRDGVQIAGDAGRAIVVASGVAWRTGGSTLTRISMPDDVPGYEGSPAPVSSVACIKGFFLLAVAGTQRFYWIVPGEDDPDALDFASAERTPDRIVSFGLSGDEIWMLGGEGEEVWALTGDDDAPIQQIVGRVYANGCAAVESVANIGTTLAWVSARRRAIVAQGSPVPISDESTDDILAGGAAYQAWTFRKSGHPFYVITTDSITLAFDLEAQRWSRFSSKDRETWRAAAGAQSGSVIYAGDSESGAIWTLDDDVWQDDGSTIIAEVSGTVDNTGPPVSCNSVSIRTTVGQGGGPVEVRWSDDQGRTFSAFRRIDLGGVGQYGKDATIRSLGLIKRPGRTFVFRHSADAPWRVDYARMNEA